MPSTCSFDLLFIVLVFNCSWEGAASVAPFLFTIGAYIKRSMKNLLYCAAIGALLSSCNQTNQNENGRYLPWHITDGGVRIVDTRTGRVYYQSYEGGSRHSAYIDFVEGATPN